MQVKLLFILILFIVGMNNVFAQNTKKEHQETARERIERRQQNTTEQLQHIGSYTGDVKQLNLKSDINETITKAKWSRIIYRYLDLTKESNAPLYYPVTPENEKISLFTLLFNLLLEDKIAAYEYLDGREDFTEEYRVDLQELLDRFGMYYEIADKKITVNNSDIPSNEVMGYYVKEAYYFDTSISAFQIKPVAISPILYRQDNYNATTRYPLFWVLYEDIAPFLQRVPIMGSSHNNSISGSIDDFFRIRKYDGEIYKAQNPRNLTISQYTTTSEEMSAEQARIEQELINFEKNLWKQEKPTVTPLQQKEKRKRKKDSPNGYAPTSSGNSSISMRDRR